MRRLSCVVVAVAGLAGGVAAVNGQDEPAKTAAAAPNTSPLVHEVTLNAPVAEVWNVFSTAEGFKKLGVAQAKIDFRVGGKMLTHYSPQGVIGDDGTIENSVIAFEPMRMISFRITKPPKGFPFANAWKDTWSVATFTDLGDGRTHLRLAGMSYTADEESQKMRDFFDKGNAWVLRKLQAAYDSSVPKETRAAHAADPLAPIEIEALVSAARADAWKMYTTSEGWKQFIGVESKFGSRPGEPFEVYFGATQPPGQRGSEGCTILSLIPGEMFSYTWNAPPKYAHAREERTWVVVTFDEVSPKMTRVRLRHFGFTEQASAHADHAQEWKDTRAYFAAAWPKVLGALKAHFEPAKPTAEESSTR